MNREDLLNFNFDWRDEAAFKQALKESGLAEKDKLRLRDERMRRLELEELKAEGSDYDDFYIAVKDETLEQIQTARDVIELVKNYCDSQNYGEPLENDPKETAN